MPTEPFDAVKALPFKREYRYAVIKLKYVPDVMLAELADFLDRANLPPLECVVVESDWPEYEPVWKMIEDRVNGVAELSRRVTPVEVAGLVERLRERFEDEPDFLGHEAADWIEAAAQTLREFRKGWCGPLDKTAPKELHRAEALLMEIDRNE